MKPAKPRLQLRTGVLVAAVVIVAVLVLIFQSRINRLFEDKPANTTTLPLPLTDRVAEVQPPSQKSSEPASSPASAIPSPPVTTPAARSVIPTEQAMSATAAKQKNLQEKIIPLDISKASTPQQPTTTDTAPVAQAKLSSDAGDKPSEKPAASATIGSTGNVQTPAAPAAAVKPVLKNIEPDPVPASDKPQTIVVYGNGFNTNTRVLVRWTDKDHEIPPARVKLISDTQMQVRLTVGRDHDKWQMHVVNPGDVRSNILDFNVATAGISRDRQRDWILSQAPGKYTLQLFGSHELKNAEAFIRQHGLGEQARYFASRTRGKIMYSVIYGAYPDQATARSAIKTLPASLRKVKPWLRRFGDIQTSVKTVPQPATTAHPTQHRASPPPDANVFSTTLPKHGDVEQNESWIWSQDPSYFTLQLLGARELASVKKLLKQYPSLSSHAVYFHTRHGGRDWYAVIYGVYADRQKASAAIKRLPSALQTASPWIRTFSSIHAELSQPQ